MKEEVDIQIESEDEEGVVDESLPETIQKLIRERKVSKLDGVALQNSDIPVEDVISYYEKHPLQLYNLFAFVRWHDGISCTKCGCETVTADISFVSKEYPFFRCVGDVDSPSHRFSVFTDSIFEKARFDLVPLVNWVKLFVFYLNHPNKSGATIKEMVEVIGSKNLTFFYQTMTGRSIARVLLIARKSKAFGKNFQIRNLSHLVKVLKWIMSFNRDGTLIVSKMTSLLFDKKSKKGKKDD